MFGRRKSRRCRSLERKPRQKSVQVRFADAETIPDKLEISRPLQVRRLQSYSGDGTDFMEILPIRECSFDNEDEPDLRNLKERKSSIKNKERKTILDPKLFMGEESTPKSSKERSIKNRDWTKSLDRKFSKDKLIGDDESESKKERKNSIKNKTRSLDRKSSKDKLTVRNHQIQHVAYNTSLVVSWIMFIPVFSPPCLYCECMWYIANDSKVFCVKTVLMH